MKRISLVFSTIFLLLFLILTPKVYSADLATPSADFIEDEIIVKLKPYAPASDLNPIAQAIQGEILKELLLQDTFVLKVPRGSVEKVIKILSEMPQIATASPNYFAQKLAITNDVSLDKEWGLFKIQVASESAKSAWDTTTGKSDVKIAVLDTGIDKTHPDLEGKIVQEVNFTKYYNVNDDDGHGTHVAGIIAAVGNNSKGVAGLSYGASLMNVKVLGGGSGTYSDIINGIVWAADNGAKVINMSLGGPVSTQPLEDAVNYAYSKGAVLVAAAGNSGTNSPMYPANYTNVLSVAATDKQDQRTDLSNYGTWIKVAAPGDSIYSTYIGGNYTYATGTSMASAFTSGVAALVWSANICDTNTCVMQRITNTADAIANTGTDWKYGRINALHALTGPIPTATPTEKITPTPNSSSEEPALPPMPVQPVTSAPKPSPIKNAITVSNIEMWYTINSNKTDIFARLTVSKVSDSTKVSAASVTLDLTTPSGKVFTGTSYTNTQGQVMFALRGVKDVGVYKAQITSVSKAASTYTPTNTKYSLEIK